MWARGKRRKKAAKIGKMESDSDKKIRKREKADAD